LSLLPLPIMYVYYFRKINWNSLAVKLKLCRLGNLNEPSSIDRQCKEIAIQVLNISGSGALTFL